MTLTAHRTELYMPPELDEIILACLAKATD